MGFSHKHAELLESFNEFVEMLGRPPTLDELRQNLGFEMQEVKALVLDLLANGMLKKEDVAGEESN